MSRSVDERFAALWAESPAPYGLPEPCWLWQGSTVFGYGLFNPGKTQRAHRWSYERFVGPIPDGLGVRHRCDRRSCVNPAHLLPGTALENSNDRRERNRAGWRKLPDADVAEIRGLLNSGSRCAVIARQFGVSRGMVSHIKHGRKRTKPTRDRAAA